MSHLKMNWGIAGYMELHSLVRDYLLGLGNTLVTVARTRWRRIDEGETESLELYHQTCER